MEKKYFIQENGAVSQPYSLDDFRSKNIAANTLVCVKFGEWKAAKDIPEVAELLEWQPTSPSETNWAPPPPQVQNPNMQQSQQQPQPQQQTIIIAGLNRKSTGVAFLLSFFFGPLGLFYASVTGGLVMLVLSVIIGIITLGFGLVLTWIGSIIWAMVAVNKYNENLNKPLVSANQPQQQYQQPQEQPIPMKTPSQTTASVSANQPKTELNIQPDLQETSNTIIQQPNSSFDFAAWFAKDFKKILIPIAALIVLGGGGYFVYKNYLIDDPVSAGLEAAKINCELSVNNTDKVIELRKEYMANFNSYNFKNRKEAIDKFDDMCKGQLADYNSNFTKSRDFYIRKRNALLNDKGKLAQFDASYNQYPCYGGKDYELDQLLNKQWGLINSTFPEQNNISPQQVTSNSSANNSSSLNGKFPQASERELTSNDISGMSKQDLKIMKNEIFARHGFIFKTPEMKSYFATQSWYHGQHDDVTSNLTKIEKQNVELIKKHE